MPRRTIILAAFFVLLSGAAIAIAAISENTGVALGGTNIAGTNGYAGAGGTNTQCQLVINALDQPYTYVVSDNAQPGATAAGCGKVYLNGGERRRYLVNPTTGSATYPAFRRACACNN